MLSCLKDSGLDQIPIVAQAYDGASVMSGSQNGVQAKVRERHSAAVYTHCMAHRLNLVLVESCKTTRHARVLFDVLESLYCFFSRPGNHKKFVEIQASLGITSHLELTQLSDTRWSCRWRNVNTTKHLFVSILSCLDQLAAWSVC